MRGNLGLLLLAAVENLVSKLLHGLADCSLALLGEFYAFKVSSKVPGGEAGRDSALNVQPALIAGTINKTKAGRRLSVAFGIDG